MAQDSDIIDESADAGDVDMGDWERPDWLANVVSVDRGMMINQASYIRILTVDNVSLDEGLIKTDTFATGYPWSITDGPASPYGFTAVNSEDAISFNALDITVGQTRGLGEGDRPTEDVKDISAIVGNIHTASLWNGTIGLGYLPVIQPSDYYTDTSQTPSFQHGKIYFHYANGVEEEPRFGLSAGLITDHGASGQSYQISNPTIYGLNEAASFQEKFGAEQTFTPNSAGNIARAALESSIDSMVETLVTSYAQAAKAFPRNPPMRLKPGDISTITGTEKAETTTIAGEDRTIMRTPGTDTGGGGDY